MEGKSLYIGGSDNPFKIKTYAYRGDLPLQMKSIVMGNDKGKGVFVTYDGNNNKVKIWGDDVPEDTKTLYVNAS